MLINSNFPHISDRPVPYMLFDSMSCTEGGMARRGFVPSR